MRQFEGFTREPGKSQKRGQEEESEGSPGRRESQERVGSKARKPRKSQQEGKEEQGRKKELRWGGRRGVGGGSSSYLKHLWAAWLCFWLLAGLRFNPIHCLILGPACSSLYACKLFSCSMDYSVEMRSPKNQLVVQSRWYTGSPCVSFIFCLCSLISPLEKTI